MKIRWLVIAIIMISVQAMTEAQRFEPESEEKKWHEDLVFGGSLGAGFFNGWNINATPFVGYKVSERFIAGVGIDFNYVSVRFDRDNKDRYTVFGPRMLGLYQITDEINLSAEYVPYRVNITTIRNDIRNEFNESQNSLLLGGGYLQRFGRGGGVRMELLYDVLYDRDADFNFRQSALVPRVSLVYGL